MGILDLGRKIYRTARKQGKSLLQDFEHEWEQVAPHWENVKRDMRNRGAQLRNQVSNDVLNWLEKELQVSMRGWRVLLGQDPDLETAYRTLDLPYGTSLQEVKLQWRKLLKQYHPDRHMSTPQQQAIATQKSQNLTAAYHQIAKAFQDHRL